jgi:hypothetical protein
VVASERRKVGPDRSAGANADLLRDGYPSPPPAKKPVWPLHATPGLGANAFPPSLTTLYPYDWATPPGFSGSVEVGLSFFPEKTQIEFACDGPAVGSPFPVTSPAKAALALAAATVTAHTAAASIDFFRSMVSPLSSGPLLAVVREVTRGEGAYQTAVGKTLHTVAQRPQVSGGRGSSRRMANERNAMRRFSTRIFVGAAAFGATLALAAAAAADAPKFHATSSSVNGAAALVVSFDERGLGNTNIDYTLTADATATFACINGGGNHPQAANKETVSSEVSAGGSFEPRNGRVQASLTAGPPSAGSFTCPNGQRLVLASVSYTNVVLTDTTNGVSASLPDASRTFFVF